MFPLASGRASCDPDRFFRLLSHFGDRFSPDMMDVIVDFEDEDNRAGGGGLGGRVSIIKSNRVTYVENI